MICYRDMTFCSAYPKNCGNAGCGRAVTQQVSAAAAKWWGGDEPPIATLDLSQNCKTRTEPNGERHD